MEWKRSWGRRNKPPPTTPKAGLHPKKVMLCIWWYWKGVLYYELLPENQTINSNKYCPRLDQLKAALNEKRPELVNRKCLIFHQDNARLHVSLMTRQKLLQLGWEVRIHPPYSPDIAPSDFRLFWSLPNSLNGKKFNSLEDCKRHLGQFFAQKDTKLGFPGGAVVENLPANARDMGSCPGPGRSHMQRSNWAREPQLLSLRVWSLCSATREAAIVRGPRTAMKSGPRLPQLEKALAQKRRPNTAINK